MTRVIHKKFQKDFSNYEKSFLLKSFFYLDSDISYCKRRTRKSSLFFTPNFRYILYGLSPKKCNNKKKYFVQLKNQLFITKQYPSFPLSFFSMIPANIFCCVKTATCLFAGKLSNSVGF